MSNLFTRFKKLLPQTPLMVGEVVNYDNGVATIQDPSGSLQTARGDVSVGDRVFFRAGAIEGPAPDLPVEVIDL